jgi:steroid Delta-isomerase
MDVRKAVADHVRRFNAAVESGDFDELVAGFAPDAVMRFEGVPVGPFVGRPAIAEGYRAAPPDDTMTVLDVTPTGPASARVRFGWDAGGTGTMDLAWSPTGELELRDLVIAFD